MTREIDLSKPLVALTFDDGPNTTTTVQTLDLLEKYGIVGSFFVIGNYINEETAPIMKRAYDMGCEINNHSRTHQPMTNLSAEEIKAEIEYTSAKVKEVIGEPTKFFRPPFIITSDVAYAQIPMPFIAGVSCSDWEGDVTAEVRAERTLQQVKDGTIILLHDFYGNDATVEALKTIIPELLNQGYEFVTVSELFRAKGVEIRSDDPNLYSFVG